MDHVQLPPQKKTKPLTIIITLGVLVLFLMPLSYLLFGFVFDTKCPFSDIPLELDENQKTYEIVFNQPVYRLNTVSETEDNEKCLPNSITSISNDIISWNEPLGNNYQTINEIPSATRFKILKRVVINCEGWKGYGEMSCGDNFILMDQAGELYRIKPLLFKKEWDSNEQGYPEKNEAAAFYYLGSELISEVKVSKIYHFCNSGGDERNLCSKEY